MNVIAMIPARYAATRFPAKLMQLLGNKTVIRTTYEAVVNTGLFSTVYVVTDSELIFNEITSNGGKAIMSIKEHESGSDRIAEALAPLNVDVVINVQGDEPFIQKEPLEKLVAVFNDPSVQVASLMRTIESEEDIHKPSCVKVVVNKNNDALYFSRSPIPYPASKTTLPHYLHVGVYGYRKNVLMQFTKWPPSPLEQTEKLEQLRYLDNGIAIRMVAVEFNNIAIDTPQDLEDAKRKLGSQ